MDYNIYIHSVSANGNQSPTSPWQLQSDDSNGEIVSGGGFSPSSTVKKAGAFLSNPDSLIGKVMATGVGKLGVAAVIISTIIRLTDKAITMYQSYAAPASGDYKFQIEYNNFKQTMHNVMTPFSTEIQRQQAELQIKKEKLANEQQMQLLGGTMINSPYGRYL